MRNVGSKRSGRLPGAARSWLGPGRAVARGYEVEASWLGQTVRSMTTLRAGVQRQVMAYFGFADDGELSPDKADARAQAAKDRP